LKKFIFSKKLIVPKECFHGQPKGSCDNPAEFCLTKGRNFFAQIPKIIGKLYFFRRTNCS